MPVWSAAARGQYSPVGQSLPGRGGVGGSLAVEDIVKFAVPYLSEHYEGYLRKHGSEPEEELRRLNFIISGYSLEGSEPYGIYLLESEKNALPFKVFPARTLLVMPRNLGMERRFLKADEGACLMF